MQLADADLSRKMKKSEYKAVIDDLRLRAAELQRTARSLGIPIVVVFEGWDAAGKGTMINRLSLALDARGCSVHPTNPPTDDEALRPFLWRFWVNTPARGRIAVFDRSWYGRVLVERVDGLVPEADWRGAYDDIGAFEHQLADDDCVIVKFFLHISRDEQRQRFEKLLAKPSTSWKVSRDDWKHYQEYDRYVEAIDEMLDKTNSKVAPWTVVESENRRYAVVKVFQTLIAAVERKVEEMTREPRSYPKPKLKRIKGSVLDHIDLSRSLSRDRYNTQLKRCQKRIRQLEHEVYINRIPVIIVYEGSDAAGKGGNIRRLLQGMDPRGYEVVPIAAPTEEEKRHHYLWRFWQRMPKAGHITIFDRSWYGRVLVERIEGFCRKDEWQRAYREINEMEAQLAHAGAVIVKFWLQIDQDEQLARFKARQTDAHKQWKITDEDWRNRERWDDYRKAVDEMLLRTGSRPAPWTVIESNDKLYARIKAIKTVIKAIEAKL